MRLAVRVTPRASRDELAGERQGALYVRLTAPPVEGRANDALRKLLARWLGVPRSRVKIAAGKRARTKTVHIAGLTAAEVLDRLP